MSTEESGLRKAIRERMLERSLDRQNTSAMAQRMRDALDEAKRVSALTGKPKLSQVIEEIQREMPVHLAWTLPEIGDIDPINDDEARRCSERKLLSHKIRVINARRSYAEEQIAREAWANVMAPKRSAGKLALPMAVKWQGDPEPDDDIPF